MADLIMKQARAIIDSRTTIVCLDIHGIIMPVDQPFETLAGDFMQPPFHIHCRTLVGPHMAGFIAEARREANKELKRRPRAERKRGEEGPDQSSLPRPVTGNPPSGFSRRDEEEEFRRQGPRPQKLVSPKVPKAIQFKKPDPKDYGVGPEEARVRGMEEDLGFDEGHLNDPENVRRLLDDLNELLDEEESPQMLSDRDLLVRWLATPSREAPPVPAREVFAEGVIRDQKVLDLMLGEQIAPEGHRQISALADYLFNSFALNRSIREDDWHRLNDKRRVEGLDALIAAQKGLAEDVVVWRGMPASAFDFDTWDGREMTDPAFMSTAPVRDQAEQFARKGIDDSGKGVLVEILVPAGTKGASPHFAMLDEADEYEIAEDDPAGAMTMANELILPRGTTLRFVGEPEDYTTADGAAVRKVQAVVVNGRS